jgi:sigma-B regulation protein RsbU (phosphoserine phosphatase)
MIHLNSLQEKPNLQDEFAYRQIGSLTVQIDPMDVSASLESVMDFFKSNDDKAALPIERNGILIGILERTAVEKMNESAWARFWQKDLDAYIQAPLLSLRADEYIEKNIGHVMELNHEKGVRFFAVYYRKSFFGIVGMREMLTRITELRNRDMERARLVQQNLLEGAIAGRDPRYELITWNRMANEVGGDYYKDFAFSDGDRRIIACFDVSGKNVAASLSTMAVGSFFAAMKHFEQAGRFGEAATVMFDKFVNDLTPGDMFVTAAICYIDFKAGEVLIQNCGHTPIYFYIPKDGKIVGKSMNANLPPLGMGILDKEEGGGFKLPIATGLRIVLYTDGLTDMMTPDGERYDNDRTRDLLTSTYGKSAAETQAAYAKAIEGWIAEAMLPDDITVMDIRFA